MLPILLLAVSFLNAPDLSPVDFERPCGEPRVALVADGRPCLPIVTADGKRERWAAMYLAATIRDITGVRPTVYVETPSRPVTNSPALRIFRAQGGDVFRVITRRGSVSFLGRSDFAVFDWCERVLGVRYYCEDGKTFPRSDDLTVPAVDYADRPVFSHRDNWPVCRRLWARVSKVGGAHALGVNVHAPHRWFSDPDVRTNHPNVFARQPDGSRGEMPLLCYGSPETLEYYKRRIDEHIAGLRDSGGIVDTNRHVITVSQWDCRLECTCESCRRLFDPDLGVSGSGSPVIWGRFLADLSTWAAATHPDYVVSFLPYLNTCGVPAGLRLPVEGNCEAMLCSMPGLAMFKEPSVRAREESLIRDWACVTGRKVLNWHYACWPREFTSAPYLFGRTIVRHYRRMAPCEVGSFVNGGDATAAEQLSNYVWLRCLWNPAIDVEAVYDVFAARMFGAAASPMRRLIALQEDGWERPWPWPHVCMANVFGVSYPPEVTDEMKSLLLEAMRRAAGDALALSRVRWYAKDFGRFFADAEDYAGRRPLAELTVPRVDREPAVDGRFDDACWAHAPARALVSAFDMSQPVRNTSVRSVWTRDGIAFAVRCDEPNMAGLNLSAAYGELRRQDTLELFLIPEGGATGTCYRLMFDVRNRMVATASDREWSAAGVRSCVMRTADAWQLELYVPFSALDMRGSPSQADGAVTWLGNFSRWHPGVESEREWCRLSTRGSIWNQDPDAFSPFRFHDAEIPAPE